MIKEFAKKARAGSIDLVEHTRKAIESAQKINEEYKYITELGDAISRAQELQKSAKEGKAKGKLFGVLITAKDAICVQNLESTASSAILKGYKPLYNATVIERCLEEGAIILGKTVQDEFGFGGFCTNVGKGYSKPKNPNDKKRVCGGSSGGAAGITKKADFAHIALAESTGGSIANPASFCGVVGLTPTYGRVSRHGLISYANSLDKIGAMAKTVEDAALLLEIISGADPKDSTSASTPVPEYSEIPGTVQGIKIGVLESAVDERCDNSVRKAVLCAISKLEELGARRINIELPLNSKYALAAYYILALSEASTNLAKFCGIRYGAYDTLNGTYNDYFSRVRSDNFGDEAKRRILLGTFARMAGFRDAFYTQAAKIRTQLIKEYKEAFKKVDVIITPSMPTIAPTFEHVKKLTPLQSYLMDELTCPPNLAGLPHISIPCAEHEGLPIGLQIIGDHFCENKIIQVAKTWSQISK
ncbi:Asp-tRNA(Asn)/Glu-tRNA(Gln) amidotransferase subunit GatA [Candidatus Woesearchaeota archaeon]|nr:MAG: Asp-tRNA(Asn)/Glu-tRNA(Gln) amidotransferase subunit GatA [Candidatus Woesearchaeota archaeon]